MELRLLIEALLRRWYCVVLPVLIAGIFAVPELLSAPSGVPSYSASIRYTAAQVLEAIPNRDGDYQDVWLASELTVNAFTDWVRGSRFEQMVRQEAERQGLSLTTGAFSISAENDKSVGKIILTGADAEQLGRVAEAAVTVMRTASREVFPQLGGEAAQVELLDEPQVTTIPPPIANRLLPVIRVALAALLGIGLALVIDYADPFLRRRAQLESAGIRVLVSVPRE
jgi:hypothetical protein